MGKLSFMSLGSALLFHALPRLLKTALFNPKTTQIYALQFNQGNFPPKIVEKFKNQTLTLEDLFDLGTDARL